MAKTFNNARIAIKYDCGLNNDGKTIMRSKSYGDVRETATDVKIRAVVNGINSLINTTDSELETSLIVNSYIND